MTDAMRWIVVVPVKVASAGKTRLAGVLDDRARAALVRAMALDTVDAASRARSVARVLVVTADPELIAAAGRSFAVVGEPALSSSPLDAAVLAGVAAARSLVPRANVAALLGDVPALRSADLEDALALAAAVRLGFVADAEGAGTTLLTARGVAPEPHFGAGSAAAHTSAGHVPLDVTPGSTLRRDVDVPADLEAVVGLGPGPRTAALLGRLRG